MEIHFNNPLNIPIDNLTLTIKNADGSVEQIKAIDKFWVKEKVYPEYTLIPTDEDEAAVKLWIGRANEMKKYLLFLENLPFYKFWSYVVFEPGVCQMLDSFLKNAVPSYLPQPKPPFIKPYTEIYSLVLRIYKLIMLPKVSESEYFTLEAIGLLLANNNIITNYILWDLCKLYGNLNDEELKNSINYMYEIIPNLKEELSIFITGLGEIFEAIGTSAYENSNTTERSVTDLTYLLYDTAFAINTFLKIYPPFKDICCQENFFSIIIHTYNSEIPILYDLMKSVYINDFHPAYDRVNNARTEMLEICYSLMNYCMDMIMQNIDIEDKRQQWTKIYLNSLERILSERLFLIDFNKAFPLQSDIEMLMSISSDTNKEYCNKLLTTLTKYEVEESAILLKQSLQITSDNANLADGAGTSKESEIPENVILESKISELHDVFPDLGEGFLSMCLNAMQMDTQAVIMAILDNKLPIELSKIDKNLPRIPPESEAGPSIVESYVGKKPSKYKTFNELVNDKSYIQEQKERFQLHGNVFEDDGLYNDDYIETEDEYVSDVSSLSNDAEEIQKPTHVLTSESEVDNEEKTTQPPKNEFCEDPAVIRARREAHYQNSRHCKKPTRNEAAPSNSNKIERNKKTAHKATRGNHNRRRGAQFKRNQGMLPS